LPRRLIDVMPSLRDELERGAIASVDEHQVRVRILPVGTFSIPTL